MPKPKTWQDIEKLANELFKESKETKELLKKLVETQTKNQNGKQ